MIEIMSRSAGFGQGRVDNPARSLRMTPVWIAVLFLVPGGIALAQQGHPHPAPYAGQQMREIKSLSPDDIAELRRGGGWGLAKPAELNGLPGPVHLLELKGKIGLSADQVTAIQAIFEKMRTDAIAEGERLIARERALEEAFRSRNVDEDGLRRQLAPIEESRSTLRHIHLAAHLRTAAILSDEQIASYNALRGYGARPCATVPKGHDPAMWRKHNGCG
jgi:Spy/CpxP family protein refolding chaperone